MGTRPNPNTWKTGAEANVIRQENAITASELVRKFAIQAQNYAQAKENAGHVASFIKQGFVSQMQNANNPESVARYLAFNEPHFVPDTIEDLKQKMAFLQALAIELSKPEYNQ